MISATTGEWYWILGTRIDIWWYMLASWVSKASVKDDQGLAAGHYEKRWHVAHRFDRPWENRGFLWWINGASTSLRINMGYPSMLLLSTDFMINDLGIWLDHQLANVSQLHSVTNISHFVSPFGSPCFLEPDSRPETAMKLLFSSSWNQWNPVIFLGNWTYIGRDQQLTRYTLANSHYDTSENLKTMGWLGLMR